MDSESIAKRTASVLQQLIDARQLNALALCNDAGISRAKFYAIINGTTTNVPAPLVAFLEADYGINSRFLLFGKIPIFIRGTMAKKVRKLQENCKVQDVVV